jgi:hypothetical protein
MRADERVLAYCWIPKCDWLCRGGRQGVQPLAVAAPPGRVFTLLATEYEDKDRYGVSGSIEDFMWIREDSRLRGAPINYDTRYREHLWSRS